MGAVALSASEGIGENIEIEFVDPSGSGEYRITSDPCEKDALAHVPGAGRELGRGFLAARRKPLASRTVAGTCARCHWVA